MAFGNGANKERSIFSTMASAYKGTVVNDDYDDFNGSGN